MKLGVKVELLKTPPMKIRWPTSIDELPNRLLGLNQLLLKKQISYVLTALTSIVCTVSTRLEVPPPVSPTHMVTVCTGPVVGFKARMRPETKARSVVMNSTS